MTTEQLEQMVFDDFIEYLIINGTGGEETITEPINVWDKIAEQQSK